MSSHTTLFERIADGLADQGFAVTDHFFSPAEVEAILMTDEFREIELHFKKAGTGRTGQINEAIRGDFIRWIDKQHAPPVILNYLQRLEELTHYLNRTLFLSLKDYEVHMTAYPPGSFYKRHLDQFKTDDHRKLSVICYLNQHWKEEEGGQLRLYLPHETRDILPTAGRLICFRSDQIEHEVLPATRERLSLTGWLLDQISDFR